ncbi:MAG: response regulator transcription factor [Lachnospiraceae bacterium]|nr:response regulator transcription factor [Lachnospiraceae bacterium]
MAAPHILIIEDDTGINNMIAEGLQKSGYRCTQAFSGTEGLRLAEDEAKRRADDTQAGSEDTFRVILMDLMLPGLNGEELLPQIKALTDAPVIVTSAKDSLDSKVDLLSAGAEDYLTKPFALDELIARVGVQLRRTLQRQGDAADDARADAQAASDNKDASVATLTHKALTLDALSYSAEIDGHALSLTRQEYKILELLLSHPKRAFSKQEIYDYAWDDIYIGEDKTINVHVSNIRKKLRQYTEEEYIETVWGIGFRLSRA